MATNPIYHGPHGSHPIGRPIAGQIIMDQQSLQTKMFDGQHWQVIPTEGLQDMSTEELLKILRDRKQITDDYLETIYTDLKELRETYERKYKALSEKYRVWEILNLPGDDDA